MKRNVKTLCDVSFTTDDFKLEANLSEHRASLREFPVFWALKAVEQLFFFLFIFNRTSFCESKKSTILCVSKNNFYSSDLFVVVFLLIY
jgi:hypothetical protein